MEATKRIREGGFKNLIAGVTGNIMEDDVAEYLRAGADIVFGKPPVPGRIRGDNDSPTRWGNFCGVENEMDNEMDNEMKCRCVHGHP